MPTEKSPNNPAKKARVSRSESTTLDDKEIAKKPLLDTGMRPSCDRPRHNPFSRPAKPEMFDITAIIHSIVNTYKKLWTESEDTFYEYIIAALYTNDLVKKDKIIAFEAGRFKSTDKDYFERTMYPILDQSNSKKIERFRSVARKITRDQSYKDIESILIIYKSIVADYYSEVNNNSPSDAALPDTAITLWADAPRSESPVDFIRRIYGTYIERAAFTQADLKRLDPKLYRALFNWCYRHELKPSDIVPSAVKRTDDILREYEDLTFENSLGAAFKMAHLSDTVPSELVKRGEAYFALLRRRQKTIKRSPS